MTFFRNEPAYLDLKGAAAYCSLSVRTLRDYLKQPGFPPIYRIARKILIKRADLEAWIEGHKSRDWTEIL
jgi:predicted DNA-binding transcriptional regulator AlpA